MALEMEAGVYSELDGPYGGQQASTTVHAHREYHVKGTNLCTQCTHLQFSTKRIFKKSKNKFRH